MQPLVRRGDHVLDDQDVFVCDVHALSKFGGSVALGLLADEDRGDARGQRERRGDRYPAEFKARQNLGACWHERLGLRGDLASSPGSDSKRYLSKYWWLVCPDRSVKSPINRQVSRMRCASSSLSTF